MPSTLPDIPVFVATRLEQVPARCSRYVSVDGSVPGAIVTWDHHRTGELINLDAMPRVIDPSAFDGVGTTMADSDAVASATAVLLGGAARIDAHALGVLEAASHWCDHLGPHPAHGDDINAEGRGLHGFVLGGLARRDSRSVAFGELVREVAESIRGTRELPRDTSLLDRAAQDAAALDAAGRIARMGTVAVVDFRGGKPTSPDALYERFDCPLGLFVEDHPEGGVRYTVGLNPRVRGSIRSVRPILAVLAQAEFAHGPPALAPHAIAGAENWGGRDTVGGSPWNYGSRLSVDEVVRLLPAAGVGELGTSRR